MDNNEAIVIIEADKCNVFEPPENKSDILD